MLENLFQYNEDKLDTQFIEHLINLYNNFITVHFIEDAKYISLSKYTDRYKAYEVLKKRLQCTHLQCVISHDYIRYSEKKLNDLFIKNMKISSEAYKSDVWLSNYDIDRVMNQFEYLFLNFCYTGTVLMDFDQNHMLKIYNKFFLEKDKQKIKCFHYEKNYCSDRKYPVNSIATVYNTAKSTEQGQHWITTFTQQINPDTVYSFYFDSLGHRIPDNIQLFFKKLKSLFHKHNIHFHYFDNQNIRHQFGGSKCGLYAITFIKLLLQNSSILETYNEKLNNKENIILDEDIHRSEFFTENKGVFKRNIYP